MIKKSMSAVLLTAAGLLGMASVAQAAFELSGSKTLSAVMADGSEVEIGHLKLKPVEAGKSSFELEMDHSKFTDYFLSMREFKCLPSDQEVSCHVPYPYKSPQTLTNGDYAWLEHRLMFLFKKPAEFGAKLWNGIYFKFREEGDRLIGQPMAIDLNDISAPPEDLAVAPYTDLNRHEMNAEERWIRELRIQ